MPPVLAHAHLSADQIACEQCGRPFIKRRPWARFCTDACKHDHSKATAEANERDAERYRSLRSGKIYGVCGLYVADGGRDWKPVEGEALDEAIDQARERLRA